MRMDPWQIYFACMKGEPPCGMMSAFLPEEAYELLKNATHQDFGWDLVAWEVWLKEDDRRNSREFMIKRKIDNPDKLHSSAAEVFNKAVLAYDLESDEMRKRLGMTTDDILVASVEQMKIKIRKIRENFGPPKYSGLIDDCFDG